MPEFAIRPATDADAEAYVRCRLEAMIETYTFAGPEFADTTWATFDDWVAGVRSRLVEGQSRQFWVAVGPDGAVVGVASSGPGRAPWEDEQGLPPAPIDFSLDHIYTLARTHGSGLGQRLFDVALPPGRGAYLWILRQNPRAEAFYRRNGFVEEPGTTTIAGGPWAGHLMFRMWRPDHVS